MLLVFTDGSTLGNGKKNATGGIGIYIVETDLTYSILSEYSYSQICTKLSVDCNIDSKLLFPVTNQKCELLAIKKALLILNEKFNSYQGNIMLYSDSMYSINCVTKWYKSWKVSGWKNTKKQDVKNKEIIQDILCLLENKRNLSFHHIKSHKEKPKEASDLEILKWTGNDKADKLATQKIEN